MTNRDDKRFSFDPFYGVSAVHIAEWTGLSVGTIGRFKSGRRKPPIWIVRLVQLYRDGKVLDDEWRDYRIAKGKLYGPDGRSVRPSDIALMGLVWQALAHKDPESYYAILEGARRA